MFNKLIQNTRKPEGMFGKLILKGMNIGHSKISEWGLSYLGLTSNVHILDVGCGGGANINRMLNEISESVIDGLDYSKESVNFSKKMNADYIGTRCTIRQGDVSNLPYENNSLDAVTAFETIYFWADLNKAFAEVKRVLKPNGIFLICCESGDTTETKWTSRINGMTIYSEEDLENRLKNIGFNNIEINKNEREWLCIKAIC